ncbi:MAG: hypothetical protein JNJ63_10660 [Hyphomonadaceae bacterium]|nr:hypothetical protein [Hyphomonadaceae bacterium]
MLKKTYGLYLRRADGAVRFEPFLGATPHDALTRAQHLLAMDDGIETVDVHLGDSQLFSVARSQTKPKS